MQYLSLSYSQSGNLGDEIQSLAAEQFLPRLDGFVDRDSGLHAVELPSAVILNGWFKHGPNHWRNGAEECWPPSDQVHPIFFGFHIAFPDLLADRCVDYYRRWAPIGCRDKGTMNLLQAKGVDAFFSRCLTLTFPRRETPPTDGNVYIVEGKERLVRKYDVPQHLTRDAEYRNHYTSWDNLGNNRLKRELASHLLAEYKTKARLVVTNLLHCAMPCVAMGIPVVFLSTDNPDEQTDYRLDPIIDLIPLYKTDQEIDWDPPAPDVSHISREIRSRIQGAMC
jgi:Polysaccharide pyruvyl transferase